MKKPIQYNLFKTELRFFGGSLLKGRRKSLRPLSTKDPIHLVMRSAWAKGKYSFLRPYNRKSIEHLIAILAKRFGVRVYQAAIQGNHIHLVLRIPHRIQYKAFIKVLSSKIALQIMGAPSFALFLENLGRSSGGDGLAKRKNGFWELRPFTRVLNWGKDFRKCCAYLAQNTLEAIGFIAYTPRKNHYAKCLQEAGPP